MRKIYLFLLCPFLLASCAKNPAVFRTQSSMQLCMDYLTTPSGNVNKQARSNELNSRGENCQAYVGAAQVQNQSDANLTRTLQQIQNSTAPVNQTPQGYQQGTKTYIINGRHVTCTTIGNITNCN